MQKSVTKPTERMWHGVRTGMMAAAVTAVGLVVVPKLLAQTGMSFPGAFFSAGFIALAGTFLMGWLRLPFLLSIPVSCSSSLVFLSAISQGLSWQQLLGIGAAASLAGVILFQGAAGRCMTSWIPQPIRQVMPGALGLMLILLGLYMGRILVRSPWSLTMLGNFQDPLAWFSAAGIFVTLALMAVGRSSAIMYGMVLTAAVSLAEGFWAVPAAPFLLPEGLDHTAFQLCLTAETPREVVEMLSAGVTLLMVLSCVNWSWLQAIQPEEREGRRVLPWIFGLGIPGALLGSLPVAVAPPTALLLTEREQCRTAAFSTAFFLMLALFCEPLLAAMAEFPAMVVPVLVGGGLMMIRTMNRAALSAFAEWPDVSASVAVLVLMPLSWSISAGLGIGMILWCVMKICAGRLRDVPRGTMALSFLFAVYFLYVSV